MVFGLEFGVVSVWASSFFRSFVRFRLFSLVFALVFVRLELGLYLAELGFVLVLGGIYVCFLV